MIKHVSLKKDVFFWVIFMVLAAMISFVLLQRDKQRHFGAVSFGSFPAFHFKTTDGDYFDRRQIKSQVWAIHKMSLSDNPLSLARRLAVIEQQTVSGKRHLNILSFADFNSSQLKPLLPVHHILLGDAHEIDKIFSVISGFKETNVLLVDQNGVIRGLYDFEDVDDYRRFQGDLLRIL